MNVRRTGLIAVLFLLPAWNAAQAPAPAAPPATTVAPGVVYRHIALKAPAGEPWSIHVLEVSRKEKSIELHAAPGHDATGAMQRELPTAIAASAENAGAKVLAVVNGDYDLGAPYLGISDGLTITSRAVWTTGKPEWPNFSILTNGEPVIGVPDVDITLSSGKRTWTLAALNKPFGAAWGEGLRLYTRQYRSSVSSPAPFVAVVIGNLSRPLPLRVDSEVHGTVEQVMEAATEAQIPEGALMLVDRSDKRLQANAISSLRRGDKVKLDFRARIAGKRGIRHAIGGFPILVRDGKREIVGTPGANLKLRHPRTAACYNSQKIIFVVVDGRQPQLSVGMTLEELGDLMVSLGCTVAMNTDGGGSSVMGVKFSTVTQTGGASPAPTKVMSPSFEIVNSPSDGRERGRGNAWLVIARR